MTKIFIVAAVLATCGISAKGQSVRGAFAHANGGVALHFSPGTQRDLRSPSLLGMDLHLNRMALVAGGNALALMPNRLLLGGSAVGYRVSGATKRGEAQLLMAGALLNVGYLLTFSNRVMSYPFVGVGVNGMWLKVTNETSDDTFVFRNQTVKPGAFTRFMSRGANFEAGYTVQFLTFPLQDRRSKGGVMFGLQVGTLIFAGVEDWRESSSEQPIPSLAQALSFSPYIRLTAGLGTFSLMRMRTRWTKPRSYVF